MPMITHAISFACLNKYFELPEKRANERSIQEKIEYGWRTDSEEEDT